MDTEQTGQVQVSPTLSDLAEVASQLILMMGLDNVERSVASLRPGDVLITPDLAALGSADFGKGEAIVAA
ncbi:MAG: hypothetical protein NTV69_00805, partial [Caldilinea sp.]|nr:hypothetical protein [Caldilinea sp.]